MTTVGVIIPYYQRKPGILRRALDSILAQKLPAGVSLTVIVVDDESPAPVGPEISGLTFDGAFHLDLISQPNGGCAVARNTGMKALTSEMDFVAFLDSDDYWMPGHIAKALEALGTDYDFYFTDHGRVGHHPSLFADIRFPPEGQPEDKLRQIDGSLWEVDKAFFFRHFLRVFTVHLSSFAYRRAVSPDARFKDSLRTAGEDYLFMLNILTQSRKVCFRTEALIMCGDGINIYYGTYGWEDEGHMRRIMGDILFLYAMRDTLRLSADDAAFITRKITSSQRKFAFFSLRRWIKYRTRWTAELARLAAADRGLWWWFLPSALYVALLFPLRLYSPLVDVQE